MKMSLLKKLGPDKLVLLLLCGALLLVTALPAETTKESSGREEQKETVTVEEETYEELLEKRLTEMLASVEGVGKTKVMITLKATGEKVVLMERPYERNETSEIDSEGGSRDIREWSQSDTAVYIEESDGSRVPYVVQESKPEIEGVIVIAQGGDNIYTIKEIMEAVSALFDVPSHKIKVMKMRES